MENEKKIQKLLKKIKNISGLTGLYEDLDNFIDRKVEKFSIDVRNGKVTISGRVFKYSMNAESVEGKSREDIYRAFFSDENLTGILKQIEENVETLKQVLDDFMADLDKEMVGLGFWMLSKSIEKVLLLGQGGSEP